MTRLDPDFPLLPYDLSRAPELGALALLNETLHISVLSLCAEHPTLQNDPAPHEPTALRRARRLISAIRSCQNALDKYRDAVYLALCPPPPRPARRPVLLTVANALQSILRALLQMTLRGDIWDGSSGSARTESVTKLGQF